MADTTETTNEAVGAPERRTYRKYAHELYPHADEYQIRPLSIEVPYLYARAYGFNAFGTSWHDLTDPSNPEHVRREGFDRITMMIEAQQRAFLADALLQDMVGDEAWEWAHSWVEDAAGEMVWDRAEHYGVDLYAIKPYPCGPEKDSHVHWGQPDHHGDRRGTHVKGRESECPDCSYEVEQPDPNQLELPLDETPKDL